LAFGNRSIQLFRLLIESLHAIVGRDDWLEKLANPLIFRHDRQGAVDVFGFKIEVFRLIVHSRHALGGRAKSYRNRRLPSLQAWVDRACSKSRHTKPQA
jgi:hypothetical protein